MRRKARRRWPERMSRPGTAAFLTGRNHGFVNRIIMQPHFGQARAKLPCDTATVASRPGPARIPDSSAPQPPGVRTDRARVCVRFNPQSLWPALCRPFFRMTGGARSLLCEPRQRDQSCFWDKSGEQRGRSYAQRTLLVRCKVRCKSPVMWLAIGSSAAPNTGPGLSRVPFCTMTAAASMWPSSICDSGTLHVESLPL